LCNASPRYNWSPVVLTKTELTRRVRAWGARRNRPEKDIATVDRLDISHVNQFGRPVRFILTDTRGNRFSLNGEETRWACNADANGGSILLSSFFKPVNEPDAIRFADGHGYGHGVGLCQWCTEARAEQGMRHEDIVRLAYPRSVLVAAY
jgi:SpoIID/LytB domain protein